MTTHQFARVLSIQSHVVHGYVGNKAATFPLQLLGMDVDGINSVQFSNHSGYPHHRGEVLDGEKLLNLVDGLEENQLLNGYTHIITGYCGSVTFLSSVLLVVKKLKTINKSLMYVCDPVLGDHGRLYVPQESVRIYRDQVIPVADIITPNYYECELLCGIQVVDLESAFSACQALHKLGPKFVVITSIPISDSTLLLFASDSRQTFSIRMNRVDRYFTGTGDLMSALILAYATKFPDDFAKCCLYSLATVQAVLKRTDAATSNELLLVQSKSDIENPRVDDFEVVMYRSM